MGYRYIGSKDKLAATLIEKIRRKCPAATSVIDLMAGTGLFSLALRREGYRVIASDVMTYSYHHLVVNLKLNHAPKFDGLKGLVGSDDNTYENVLEFLNQCQPELGFFTKEYSPSGRPTAGCKSRMYFTSENASKIDAIRRIIKEWHENKMISDVEHSLLLHYLSHFVQRSTEPIFLRPSVFEVNGNTEGHEIRRGYAEELSPLLTGDVCYIDPPYIKRQYAANYHILETLAREDEPEAIGESGLRPWRDQYSNFCSKVRIRNAFDLIIKNINCRDIFISYSEDGLLPIDDLMAFLRQYGNVELSKIRYKRFRSNNSKKELELTEYLIYLNKNV